MQTTKEPILLKVRSDSDPCKVAGAIAGEVRECGWAEVRAIGAGAVNQAVKAVAIAIRYLEADGIRAVLLPSFAELEVDGEPRTAIRLRVEPR